MNIYLPEELVKYIFDYVHMNVVIKHIHNLNDQITYSYNNYLLYGNIEYRTTQILCYQKNKIFRKCGMRLLIHNTIAQLNLYFKEYFEDGLKLSDEDKQIFMRKHNMNKLIKHKVPGFVNGCDIII